MKKFKNLRKTGEAKHAFKGTVQSSERGFAFILPDDREKYKKDFFVPRSLMNGALDGDKVLAVQVRGTKDEAEIIAVAERGRRRVVGVYERGKLYPDDPKLPEIIVPLSLSLSAENGDKALCEITCYPKNGSPKGKVLEILGKSGDFEAEELSIIRAHGLYEEFPAEAEEEAERRAAERVSPVNRKDLRNKLIFTVDGEDTRDIDDGVSLETVDGNFVLGVHIADVSNYVKYRSPLDEEAYARGTSVYFPDRVLPMLPKALSNGACSLNEGEDRYALSCIMTFGKDGARLNTEICESIIRSSHKLTYPEVTEICKGGGCGKYSDIAETVKDMERLCLILEERRKAAGEVDLDLREAKIFIDGGGNIVIPEYERGISERIIEQFMIAANEAVAEFLQAKGAPCLYRIHEPPSPEKLETLSAFLRELGMNVALGDDVKPKNFQNVLNRAKDEPYAAVVKKAVLRSMQKARYCGRNAGHFGLASACYCHFTSPIRRYPDLFVHRVIKDILHAKSVRKYSLIAESAGKDCSERERIADEAERDVDDLYKAVYMSDREGEIYEATVSGVSNAGVFCELDNTVEGLIPMEILPDDRYELIPERFILKGARRSFKLGQKLKVRVESPDFGRMRVIFSLAVNKKR